MALPLGEPSLAGDPNVVESSMVMNRGLGSPQGGLAQSLGQARKSCRVAQRQQRRREIIKVAEQKSNWRCPGRSRIGDRDLFEVGLWVMGSRLDKLFWRDKIKVHCIRRPGLANETGASNGSHVTGICSIHLTPSASHPLGICNKLDSYVN